MENADLYYKKNSTSFYHNSIFFNLQNLCVFLLQSWRFFFCDEMLLQCQNSNCGEHESISFFSFFSENHVLRPLKFLFYENIEGRVLEIYFFTRVFHFSFKVNAERRVFSSAYHFMLQLWHKYYNETSSLIKMFSFFFLLFNSFQHLFLFFGLSVVSCVAKMQQERSQCSILACVQTIWAYSKTQSTQNMRVFWSESTIAMNRYSGFVTGISGAPWLMYFSSNCSPQLEHCNNISSSLICWRATARSISSRVCTIESSMTRADFLDWDKFDRSWHTQNRKRFDCCKNRSRAVRTSL